MWLCASSCLQIPVEDKQKTAVKVIVTGENEKVVGIHVIGLGADEMMQGFGVAMQVMTVLNIPCIW